MSPKNYLLFLIILCFCSSVLAQFKGFEKDIPQNIKRSNKHELSLSSLYYKEGSQSLLWNFSPNGILDFSSESVFTPNGNNGITLWIYNEEPQQDSLRFEFYSAGGDISFHFGFRLYATGWRACWISFNHMQGSNKTKEVAGYRIVAPNRKGRVFLDRLTFPVKKINDRTTPDLQMPTNNSLSYRDLWHWCRVWQWEQYTYDIPLAKSLNTNEKKELKDIEQRLTQALNIPEAPKQAVKQAYSTFRKVNIQHSGKGFIGAPIVAPDELNRRDGEISWNDLETMLAGFAYDAYYNHSKTSLKHYFTVWGYAIDQGFAYGSGMGTNHHYGYQIRKIYTTSWLMRDAIWKSSNRDKILSTLIFWSALQETRIPFQYGRDELLDSWHTLLMPRTISALMFISETERARALKGLSRWISGSLQYTPGTIGGIKIDGTTFHHGGFYPAYAIGVFAMIGQFIELTTHTQYLPTLEARKTLKSAFIAMRNYSNKYEWGIGISGRHPFKGSMKKDDVEGFASLALSGDLSDEGYPFDRHLAADYLRLCDKNTPKARYFKSQGVQAAKAPEGFFVYNYGASGIFRLNNWMVTLKGYNTDVWSSEIYKKDNRYGRYQSYGSVQIMGQPSRTASGYDENGWDWNRLPGTTTIHLPFKLLDSPLSETTMAHSKENFAGSSSLENRNGMFAIKLMECNFKNFTPDFVARKSVFCFGNRMICLGSGINNSNHCYPTETTLFQSTFHKGTNSINVNGNYFEKVGWEQELISSEAHPVCISDSYNNHYFVKEGKVKVQIAEQKSRHEKTRAVTQGIFASSWIDHGKAPQNATYEYMVWIQPDVEELANKPLESYKVLQHDNNAHIVYDCLTNITAYALFEPFESETDKLFRNIPAETMLMYRNDNNRIILSVCDPNLNISEKAYTTKEPSRIIKKELKLKGLWKEPEDNKQTEIFYKDNYTFLTVNCQHGQPVETILIPYQNSDFETIYNRMYEKYLDRNPSKETIGGLMKSLSPEGAFVTLNYHATDGSPRKHVQNLISLACAYQHPENAFYHDKTLKESYLKALRFWIDTNHQAKNWWYRYIPYPKELSASVVLMSREINENPELFDKTIKYLRWSYENAAPSHMTGANGADIIMGSFAASILTKNEAQMEDFKERMTQLLTIQLSEGIQPDYLFGQHCGHGRQLYFTSYGKEFVNSTLAYLELCKDTRFQSPGLELLQRLFTDGVQWIFYDKQHDPNNAGRFISSDQYSSAIRILAERIYKLSKSDAHDDMKQALQHIGGDNGLTGNRMFWRFDYMVHRRHNYMVSSRMTSTRTVGNEAGNGDGEFNYYTSNGVNYLFVTGHEYDGNFFKIFNNRQYPGITAEQDNAPLPIPDWGEGGNNGNSFAGGVSDSLYGACGMILDRRGLQAHKAWFYFDDEFICLGAGICNTEGKAEVFTTLNQCNRDGKVQYMANGEKQTLKNGSIQTVADWILHGQTAYFNLLPQTEYKITCDTALFSLNVNHGIRPKQGEYAYVVCPNIPTPSAAAEYAAKLPIKILANTEKMQAVRHEKLGITEIIFYQPGELKLENGDILATDTPCALLWKEKEKRIHIANPRCESENPEKATITLTQNGQFKQILLEMPQKEEAGKSCTASYASKE